MKVINIDSPTRTRLQNSRFSESYLHELPELAELTEAPVGGMICRIEPGEATDADFHNQSELFVVVTGTGSVIAAGETTAIDTGEIFTLPRKVEHVIKNTGSTVLTFVSVWWPRTELEQ
jgi:quercetin dioxygenase-like cupin family protein